MKKRSTKTHNFWINDYALTSKYYMPLPLRLYPTLTFTHIPHWRETKCAIVPGIITLADLNELFAGHPEIKCIIKRKRGYVGITYTNVSRPDHDMIVSYFALSTTGVTVKSKVAR
jgi:hypothetical protein